MADHPLLKNVRPDQRFFLPDGSSISNLNELSKRISSISETAFRHHVTATKNDFHSWVSHVIRDTHLSKDIKDVKDQKKMASLVAKRVAELEARDARREISNAIATHQQAAPSAVRPRASSRSSLEDAIGGAKAIEPATPSRITQPARILSPSGTFKPLYNAPRHTKPLIPSTAVVKTTKKQAASTPLPLKVKKSVEQELKKSAKQTKTKSPAPKAKQSTSEISLSFDDSLPNAPQPFYAKPSSNIVDAACDHIAHFSCVRCGMMEFGMALAIGILSTLMFAKAFM